MEFSRICRANGLLVAIFLLGAIGILHAAVFSIADGDVTALKNAIITANINAEDDTINLASGGTYTLVMEDNSQDGSTGLPVIGPDSGHSVTINGFGATIQCDQSNGPKFRVLNTGNGTGTHVTNVTISFLTVNGGQQPGSFGGGCIFNGTGTLLLQNCSFNDNLCQGLGGGGAIFNGGMLTVQNCIFTGNFTSGVAPGGGAIFNHQGTGAITTSTFSDNGSVTGGGGAIFNDSVALDMVVDACTFADNNASSSPGGAAGGAIHNEATMTLTNSLLTANSVRSESTDGKGGAISNNGTFTLKNCTLFNNSATGSNGGGGALYNFGNNTVASMTVTSCTMNGNKSPNGSAIYVDSLPGGNSLLQIRNTILAGGTGGASMSKVGAPTSISSQGYNLSDDAAGGFLTGTGDQINTSPNFDPAGLQDNGGPTKTFALTSNSAAIDKGKSFGLTTDQRGHTRPVDLAAYPNAIGGDGSDIGAFEGNDSLQAGSTLIVNTVSDHADDGTCGETDCTLREAIHRATNAGAPSIIFGAPVTGTIALTQGQIDVNVGLAITGPGARVLTVSGNNLSRVFSFNTGTSVLSGITVGNGHVAGTPGVAAQGGAIYHGRNSNLSVTDCTFTGNSVLGGTGFGNGSSGVKGQGGAIYSEGFLTLTGCTFSSSNTATGGNGVVGLPLQRGGDGGAGEGGAVFYAFVDSSHFATLTNCTFYGNTARGGNGGNGGSNSSGGNGGNGDGGAVGNIATLTMTACTVSSNNGGNSSGGTGSAGNGTAGVASGGIWNRGSLATVQSTISANNVGNGGGGADVDGVFNSLGYNLLGTGDHSTGFTATGDIKGTDAVVLNAGVLGPPSNTGGPTDTFTLTANSPAINASNDAVAPHRDQRGYLRTARADIGAFEFNGSLLNLISVAKSGVDLVVSVEVVKGKVYGLQRKSNITDAQWQTPDIMDLTATGNDTESLKDFNAITNFNHAFYHVIFLH
jgi:hypothetical protein